MKFLEYVNIHSWLYEFAIHNINLDSLVDILDKKHRVTVIEDSPYDPNNEKLRI